MAAASGPFALRQVVVDGASTHYALFDPVSDPALPLPVIVFLHGAGEMGADGILPTTVGLGPAVAAEPSRFPARIVFPQASRGYGWSDFNLRGAIAALDDVEQHHAVERDRIYITGISMGGYGTWLLALTDPRRYAAIVPVCGGLDVTSARRMELLPPARSSTYDDAANRLASIPQWVFHGDADEIVHVEQSRRMVDALRKAGAAVHYTECPGVGHNSWDRAYAEPALMPWLFAQRRSAS